MSQTLLRVDQLGLMLNQRPCLEGLSFTVKAGELIGILGPNGAGKSSLLRCLTGLNNAYQGQIHFEQQNAKHYSSQQRARFLGYLPQAHPVHWPLQVEQVVALGLTPQWLSATPIDENGQAQIDAAMQSTDVSALRQRPMDQLSGGEQLRALLARVLVGAPRVLLADEPVASLDPYHQLSIMEKIKRYSRGDQQQTRACLVVLHDLNLAARYCDRILLLDQGRLIADGSPQAVLEPERLKAVYRVDYTVEHSPFRLYPKDKQSAT